MNSYQKLKAKIEELEIDINVLVFTPDSLHPSVIKAQREFMRDVERKALFGQRSKSLEARGFIYSSNLQDI